MYNTHKLALLAAPLLFAAGCSGQLRGPTTPTGSEPAPTASAAQTLTPSTPPGRVLERACDEGESARCTELARLYLHGGDGVTRDRGEALALFDRACLFGDGRACFEVALAKRPIDGDDTSASRGYHINLWRACALGVAPACTASALAQDYPPAQLEAFTRGCELGDQVACKGVERARAAIEAGGYGAYAPPDDPSDFTSVTESDTLSYSPDLEP